MKRQLKRILKRSRENHCISHRDAMIVQGEWLRKFGTGGCYYPNVTEWDMLRDLLTKGE